LFTSLLDRKSDSHDIDSIKALINAVSKASETSKTTLISSSFVFGCNASTHHFMITQKIAMGLKSG
jgi:hypothetical protein